MIPKNPQSKRTTDALVKATSKRAHLIQRYTRDLIASDRELGHWMVARYGDRYHISWALQFALDHVADPDLITLEVIDAHMTAAGFPPLKP